MGHEREHASRFGNQAEIISPGSLCDVLSVKTFDFRRRQTREEVKATEKPVIQYFAGTRS
jgi:hypothetical protein